MSEALGVVFNAGCLFVIAVGAVVVFVAAFQMVRGLLRD